jgi:predicted Rossmann fold nucleotide-binding protein DprA/Smf involved in DNA uptake
MQEPLDNLSDNAQRVHAYLDEDPDRTEKLEVIARAVGLTPGRTAEALRELEAGQRAVEAYGGWSVLR